MVIAPVLTLSVTVPVPVPAVGTGGTSSAPDRVMLKVCAEAAAPSARAARTVIRGFKAEYSSV
jgi:hypothetical protein